MLILESMLETLKKEKAIMFVFILFAIFSIWWIILRSINIPNDSNLNQLWAALYGVVALWGGIWGLAISRKWGGIRSIMGKSILFFALGLLFQEVGQLAYSYYIYFLQIPLPYPSWGDLFFYGTIPFYITAVIYLARVSGVHISLRSIKNKVQAVLIPGAILLLSYLIFLQGYEFDWTNPIKVVIDFGAPLGQAVYISLAILTYTLSRGVLGGEMKSKVLLIILALVAQFIADWTFLYQASREIWYAGGINDYMYFCAYFLMTVALLKIDIVINRLKH